MVNFTGAVDVFLTYPSEKAVWQDVSGVVVQQSFGAITATSAALTSGTITGAPVNATDIVNKEYADSIASGLNYHQPVNYASTAALATYNAFVAAQAIKAAGTSPTRASLLAAIDAKGASFASAALIPLNYSKTSHVGYNGYWFGQLNATGELKPYGGTLAIFTTDSGAGAIEASTYKRPTMPKNGIPTNS